MIRRRERPDGLPYRVYERRGVRDYSIGYKLPSGAWAFRLKCPATDHRKIHELRSDAIRRAAEIQIGKPEKDTFSALIDAWFAHQEKLPPGQRRAESTLAENRREAENLRRAFGHMALAQIIKPDAYAYLDACATAVPPRPAKGNKEVSLMRTILEHAVRLGMLNANPFDGVRKLVTDKPDRLVSDVEIDLAAAVGRELGGARHIVAMALKTAFLCLRRSVEVRALTRDQIGDAGIVWRAAKRKRGQAETTGLIEWSDELRATIAEALAIKRNKLAGSWYVFGNLQGQKYTKGGWKATLSDLMAACVARAERDGIAFAPFSLQDCRPKGVSTKMERGDLDVIDATMHTSERMLRQTYDRRRSRVAKPAR